MAQLLLVIGYKSKGTSQGKEGEELEVGILIALPLSFLLGTILSRKIEVRIYRIDKFFSINEQVQNTEVQLFLSTANMNNRLLPSFISVLMHEQKDTAAVQG